MPPGRRKMTSEQPWTTWCRATSSACRSLCRSSIRASSDCTDEQRFVPIAVREHRLEVRDLRQIEGNDVTGVRVQRGIVLVVCLRAIEALQRRHLSDDLPAVDLFRLELR